MAVLLLPMTKKRNIPPRSFANTRFFPGCEGNPFDRLLHSLEIFERIPAVFVLFLLAFLAVLGSLPQIIKIGSLTYWSFALLVFFTVDWLLIAGLGRSGRSFGPAKIIVLVLAVLRVPFALLPFAWNLSFEIAGTLLVVYGFWIEPFWVDLHLETISSEKLSPRKTFRVLHLGDLHMERITRREKWILQKVRECTPDLIVFSGDVLNLSYLKDETAQADALAFFNSLSAPLGIYGVSGSPAVDKPEFISRLAAQTGFTWLNDDIKSIDTTAGRINLIGVTCSQNPDKDEVVLSNLLDKASLSANGFNLLLYHSPDLAPNASRLGVDLQLSGHTHGGQVRLPLIGALYSGSLYGKRFEAGRYVVNGMTLYTSRGLGMEGAFAPRVRLLCRPEMICWTFTNNAD